MEVRPDRFILEREGKTCELAFDYGFICLGMRVNAPLMGELAAAFNGSKTELFNIGDSSRARRIIDGVREEHDVLKILEKRKFFD